MKFNNINEATTALKVLRQKNKGGNMHYPVLFKKAMMEFSEKENLTLSYLSSALDINNSTLYYWRDQFKRELYTLEGAYCVSQKSKDQNSAILTKLSKEIAKLQTKLDLVKKCSAEGLKVY